MQAHSRVAQEQRLRLSNWYVAMVYASCHFVLFEYVRFVLSHHCDTFCGIKFNHVLILGSFVAHDLSGAGLGQEYLPGFVFVLMRF